MKKNALIAIVFFMTLNTLPIYGTNLFESSPACSQEFSIKIEKPIPTMYLAHIINELFWGIQSFENHERQRKFILKNARRTYKVGKWEEARIWLSAYVSFFPKNDDTYNKILFQLANTSMYQSDYVAAVEYYNSFIEESGYQNSLLDDALWFRAQCYLAIDLVKAKSLLTDISFNNNSNYMDEAKSQLHILE